jgi:uroporphyrinogen decarboxylase
MTSKERMIAAFTHKEPDRIPRGENAFDAEFFRQIMGKDTLAFAGWKEREALWSGGRDRVVRDYIDALVELTLEMGWDYVRVPITPKAQDYSQYKRIAENVFTDGKREFTYNPKVGAVIVPREINTDMTVDDLGDVDAPFEVDDSEMDILRGVVSKLGKTHFIIGRSTIGGTFPWNQTVGLEEFLVRMITDPEFVHKATAINNKKTIKYAEAIVKAGADAVFVSEDYADNRGLMMGKERYEKYLMPALKKLCDHVHSLGAYFIKHTDGNMWDALDSFADMGIDAWHGIQPSVGMDMKKLKERFKGRLCLIGGVNVETLMEGTVEEVQAEAKYAMKYAAPGGGHVLSCGNVIEPGTPPENARAMKEANERWGYYPLNIS